MSLPIVVPEAAQADINQAVDWYRARSEALGLAFVQSLDALFSSISQQPELFPKAYRSTRMGVLRKFPYIVVYRVFPGFISIVSVMHGHRHPQNWKSRTNK